MMKEKGGSSAVEALQERSEIPASRRILLDLDGTLITYTDAWRYEGFGEPNPEGVRLLKMLKTAGYYVTTFSARTDTSTLKRTREDVEKNVDRIWRWLARNGLKPFVDEVWPGDKPLGIIVDDRAVRFKGEAGDIMTEIIDVSDESRRVSEGKPADRDDSRGKKGIRIKVFGLEVIKRWLEKRRGALPAGKE
jgi:hypothetical protein